jgi:hypothetical protein
VLIVPAWEVTIHDDIEFLDIGSPGFDGIRWGYRIEQKGLWAYYPIDDEFIHVGMSVSELVERWRSGELKL